MTRARWTPEAVLDAIRRHHAEGRPINYAAVVADDEKLTGAARRYYGSWDAALAAAGFDPLAIKREVRQMAATNRVPDGTWTAEAVIDGIRQAATAGEDLSAHRMQQRHASLVGTAQRLFGSWGAALQAAGYAPDLVRRARAWTDEQIIERIRQLAADGADLSDNSANAWDSGFYASARERFGSWPAALEAAGVDEAEARRTVRWSRNRVLEAIRAGRRDAVLKSIALDHFPSWSEALRAAGVPDETPARVGNRIRERRLALGMSQEELGQMIGYSHRAIGLLESGQWRDPRVSVALRLARALGCAAEQLFLSEE
ncbi:MAG TPA: helix-turn-helix transcriptional regulator [Firmicutes bacterium]|nr:helix-turn-helix transcriptional regulator [Bacillota bacterium]